jgi:uncharacterized membrane protein
VAVTHAHHDHGHSHGGGFNEDWQALEGTPVRTILYSVVAVLAVATLIGLVVWWPSGHPEVHKGELGFGKRVDATVTGADIGPCSYQKSDQCKALTINITGGPDKGTETRLEFNLADRTPASRLNAGDKIVLNDAGPDTPAESRYTFADMQRASGIWILLVVFTVAVIALGRLRGFLALVGIGVSIVVLLIYVFPALLHGVSPLGVALTGSSIIAFAVLYLAHGVNERTTVALLGTVASLLLTAALGAFFANLTHLSGLASEDALSLFTFAPRLDFHGLLLAAVILGALGVLDDVTITQVSAIWEIHHSDPTATGRDLYARGIRIGRDHMASAVNTLVLAYAAASLPLLLLFTQSGLALSQVLTTETVAVEIVQTLVGSIGLVASVPITTALAAWAVSHANPTPSPQATATPPLYPSYEPIPRAPIPPPPIDTRRDEWPPDPRYR